MSNSITSPMSAAFARLKIPRPTRSALEQLAARLPKHVLVHRLTQDAADYVRKQGLPQGPVNKPLFLKNPWVLEVENPERENLFGNTYNLAGFPIDSDIVLIGFCHPNTIRVAVWSLPWVSDVFERSFAGGYDLLDELGTTTPDEDMTAWFMEAIAFAVKFSYLLESETPIIRTRETMGPGGVHSVATSQSSNARVQWVHLDLRSRRERHTERQMDGIQATGHGADGIDGTVIVRGHRRKQVCGPKNQSYKWVDIKPYEQTRKVNPGLVTKRVKAARPKC